jgi:hypothetical protein
LEFSTNDLDLDRRMMTMTVMTTMAAFTHIHAGRRTTLI